MVSIAALPDIAFSKNELNLVVTSDDFIAVEGVAAQNRMIFDGSVDSGLSVRLLWANGDVTLLSAATPDDSGNQFSAGNGSETHVRAIMAQLAENYYIDRDFTLSYTTTGGKPTILFTAKKTGVLFNFSPVDGADIDVTNAVPGVNLEYKSNFAHHVEVWLKQSGDFALIYNENLQMDQPVSGITTKNIANEVLQSYLAENTDRPSLTASGWQLCTGTLLEYFVKYAQYFGDQPVVKKLHRSDSKYINLGGLAKQAVIGQTMSGYLRPGGDNSKTLCLRQGSRTKNIQTDTPEFLYWINLTGANITIALRVEMFYTSGGSGSFTVYPQVTAAWKKYYIGTGFTALNIAANLPTGKACSYYTVAVVNGGGDLLSLTYTYVVDRYREFPRYFIYLNSLGGYQTLYTYGRGQRSTDRSKDDIKTQLNQTQTATDGENRENNIRIQQKVVVNTGYGTRRDMALLNDFMVSPEIYLVSGGRLVPVGIGSNNFNEPADGDNLSAAQFEFYPLYDEDVYTDDVLQAENSSSGSGSDGGASGFNVVRDDGQNDDNVFYDQNNI